MPVCVYVRACACVYVCLGTYPKPDEIVDWSVTDLPMLAVQNHMCLRVSHT